MSEAKALSPAELLGMRRVVVVLGIPIDDLNMDEALQRLEAFIRHGRATGKSHQVATVNADFVVKALQDPELRYLLQEADMATADGMPLVWGARLLGVPLEGRVTGADLVPALAARAAEKGYSFFFLGAAAGVAERAAEKLQARHPELEICGVLSPPYSSVLDMDRQIVEQIKEAAPDILLVAFGNPKQEKWLGMYGRELEVPVTMGIGGTLDFIAGETQRAPRWMQRIGLEWTYRLLQEPGRLWRRYVVDMIGFTTFFLRQWWAMRGKPAPAALLPASDVVILSEDGQQRQTAILNVQGRLDASYNEVFKANCQHALDVTPFIVVNMAEADFVDSTVIGTLVGLAKQAREADGQLRLAGVPEPILQTLALIRLDRFFIFDDDLDQSLAMQQSLDTRQPLATRAGWAVYRTPRRWDAETAPTVAEACEAVLTENPFLVLDCSDTVFLASAGLAVMASLDRQATEKEGALRLANCSDDVLRVLQMVRFDSVLPIYDNVVAATKDAGIEKRVAAERNDQEA